MDSQHSYFYLIFVFSELTSTTRIAQQLASPRLQSRPIERSGAFRKEQHGPVGARLRQRQRPLGARDAADQEGPRAVLAKHFHVGRVSRVDAAHAVHQRHIRPAAPLVGRHRPQQRGQRHPQHSQATLHFQRGKSHTH